MIRALFQQIEMHLHKQISTHRLQTALFSPTRLHTAASMYTQSRYTQSRYTQHPPQHLLCAQGWVRVTGNGAAPLRHRRPQDRTDHCTWTAAEKQKRHCPSVPQQRRATDQRSVMDKCLSRCLSLVSNTTEMPYQKAEGEKSTQWSENSKKNLDGDTRETLLESRRRPRAQTHSPCAPHLSVPTLGGCAMIRKSGRWQHPFSPLGLQQLLTQTQLPSLQGCLAQHASEVSHFHQLN